MRHASVTLADQVAELSAAGGRWDAVFCSDMLNLPEFLALAPRQVRSLPVFDAARRQFGDRIDRWGYQETLDEYRAALGEADVFVSTARHEFFGISAVEAAAAGAMPVLPERLAYPEVFQLGEVRGAEALFYSGGAAGLADRLAELAGGGCFWPGAAEIVKPLAWPVVAAAMDDGVEDLPV